MRIEILCLLNGLKLDFEQTSLLMGLFMHLKGIPRKRYADTVIRRKVYWIGGWSASFLSAAMMLADLKYVVSCERQSEAEVFTSGSTPRPCIGS